MMIEKFANVTLPLGVSWKMIKDIAEGIPDWATVSVHVTPRDRPFDAETTTLKFKWTEEV